MNFDFEFFLSDNKDIVFRLDKYYENLYEVAKLKNETESYAYNAIRFTKEDIPILCNLLEAGLKAPKSDLPLIVTKINGTQVKIFNTFGYFGAAFKTYEFTYTEWDGSKKYDFHPWYNDYTQCDKGIRLTEEECLELLAVLKFQTTYKIRKETKYKELGNNKAEAYIFGNRIEGKSEDIINIICELQKRDVGKL